MWQLCFYRRQGIGGSDVAAILGISPFRTTRDLYDDKLNIASAADDTGNWVALEMGHLLLNAPIPIPEQRVRAEEVQETLRQMILHGAVVAYKQYLYSPRVFGQEDDTARMIAERLANISVAENIESALESVRESLGITLSQKQEQAVRTAFQYGLTIITGSPGTGKTTVLKAIIEVFKNLHPKGKFALMAPTGRASRRMAESTGVDEARTLHSALGLGTGEEIGDGERVRTVDADLIIVDEFSMVDMWLAQQFFKRVSQHTRVVLVGDPNQLPSVGAGNVFYELIHSGMEPVTVLDWIFRQSKDGLIAYNAKFINEGSTKLYYGNDFVFVDSPTQIETALRMVLSEAAYAPAAFSADWDNDETILSIIHELNFGNCAPKSQ